jgi:anaerobic selenocysteine-containing dehydrogenase
MANASEIVRTTCPRDCYDACGIVVVRRDGAVKQVRGDPDHRVARGRLCRKCSIGYNGAWRDPEVRLTRPLRRSGAKGEGAFVQISWETALAEIAARLREIRPEAVLNAHYTGTFALLGYFFPQRFFNRLGATEVDPDTICNKAGHVGLEYVWGTSLEGFDPRTAAAASCILVWGANPSASAPHQHEHWLPEAPARVIVVDPIRTPTAAAADLHLQLAPGTDAALAFSLLHVIWRERLLDQRFIAEHTIGWDELEPLLEPCTPEWGEQTTGVAAKAIVDAARLYAQGPSLLWLGQGFQRQPAGGNAMRACALLPALTGNVGKPGAGFLYLNGGGTRGIDEDYLAGVHLARTPRPAVSQMDLAQTLADPARAGALFCWNINIAASNPDQERLRAALAREDLLTVVVELFETDTTDYADYILPAASFLESNDLVASYFNLSLSAQVKAEEPPGEALPNSEIFRRLARAIGFQEPELFESDDEVIDRVLAGVPGRPTYAELAAQGTLEVFEEPALQFPDLVFPTTTGKVELASAQAEHDGFPRTPLPLHDPQPENGRLRLLSPASPWLLNDSFANDRKIARRIGPAQAALNPAEAAERGLTDGDEIELHNNTGRLRARVVLTEDVPRGIVLSHKGRWPRLDPTHTNVNFLNPGQKTDMGESTTVHGIEVELTKANTAET